MSPREIIANALRVFDDPFAIAHADAILAALKDAGLAVVPREITPAMQRAYFHVIDENLERAETDPRFGRHSNNALAYAAMIAASEGEKA